MNVYQIIFILTIVFNIGISWYMESNSSNYTFWDTLASVLIYEAVLMVLVIIYTGLGEI